MLNLLIKPASDSCNMRCKYCFYHDETSHRDVAFKGMMSDELAKTLIGKAFAYEKKAVLFAFQGGEPTLAGLDFFKNFVREVDCIKPAGARVSYTLQTNGLCIDAEWAAFLKEKKFLVGLSCDGARRFHDGMRRDCRNKPTYDRVIRAAKIMDAFGVDYNILTVVTAEIARNIGKVYSDLKRHGFRYLQFIPCLNPLDVEEELPYSPGNDDYLYFLSTLFDLWMKDFRKGDYYSIRYFDNLYYMFCGESAEQCGMQGHCNIQFVVEGNGDVYPCDFYCLDEYLLGNIKTDSFDMLSRSMSAKSFLSDTAGFDAECRTCRCFKLCRSGCRRYKKQGSYIYCRAFKDFYSRLSEGLPEIRAILQSGKYKK